MPHPHATRPSWDHLYEIASAQDGYFTTQQAATAGYSPQLLQKHKHAGRVQHVRRGIYRLTHYPGSSHDYLIEFWLWSDRQGVFSHETALALHDLSDLIPKRVHLTLPAAARARRLVPPPGVVLHYGLVPDAERTFVGAAAVTKPARTLEDCARAHLSPEDLQLAAAQALQRGLVRREELVAVELALRPFGGLAA